MLITIIGKLLNKSGKQQFNAICELSERHETNRASKRKITILKMQVVYKETAKLFKMSREEPLEVMTS